ncbi:lysylphosphatidylglycerol synthase transmembrane domain-containing protein [Halospina sp. K52047b]|uniref:lysylphosphatidylglycerol synthase transmembrane domain-containing protein n=1 Tax=Halospina sp. K52047b TaxID=2614160 RepID=UPI00124A4E17|nr:lysylphosphatidylglycerol synthase transmembrane domain-containing protein [Halospina sp. K52047b]KAA8981272.1 flippase-like domain-containing protein [Halospina sp. K52047b]
MSTASVTHVDGWRLKALVLSVAVATVGYLAFSLCGGWEEVVAAFVQISITGTAAALAMSLVNYGLRFARWQLYLSRLGHKINVLPSARIYLAGFALTTTPGKAGEAFRGLLLKHHGVPYPTSFAAFFSERLSDLVAIVILALIGLTQYPEARGLVLVAIAGIVVALTCLSSRRLLDRIHHWTLQREGKLFNILQHLVMMLNDARRCHSPGLLSVATVISIIAWGAEALAFHWVLQWLGADLGMSFAIFVYALSMLAGALSFMPGGLGGAEAVMVSLLTLKGIPMPAAVAATVFIRLATLWFAVVIGLVALIQSRHGEGEPI